MSAHPARTAAVVCLACRIDVDDLDAADAVVAAAIHDELRHAGLPTAFATDLDDPRRTLAPLPGSGAA